MILKILLLILFFATPSYAQEFALNSAIIGLAGGAGTICTTANDTELWVKTGSNNVGTHYVYNAQKLTLAATTTITEYFFTMCDNGSDAGTIRVSLYTHNAGSDQPDTEISGTDVTVAASALANCTSYASQQFTLGTPKSGIASGTYWLVVKEIGSTLIVPYESADTGGKIGGSDDGSTWTTYADLKFINALWGCQ